MSTKTKKFIRKMLDPLDMRTTSNLSIKPECLGPPPLKKSDGHYCDTFVNDSIMDQMIYGLNRHHFKNQLISERCNHENFNDHVVGNRYVL